jgi:ribA/ribD-fused uncharacterized protein
MTAKPITCFRGAYWPLSNFSLSIVRYLDHNFPTVENAFQAAKHANPTPEWLTLMSQVIASEAREIGNNHRPSTPCPLRADWEEVKESIMLDLLRQKFRTHRYSHDVLLGTRDAELIETNTWNDKEWGVCNGEGKNKLGKLLMRVRAELRSAREG